jgi:hypothetical protein
MFCTTQSAFAEMMVILVNQNSMSYELGPTNYKNSPTNYENSPTNYDNSVSNYDNSPSNYDNSPSKYENSNGKNRLYDQNRKVVGYAVYSRRGVLNIFSVSGTRLGYMPAGNNTQSIFGSESSIWCGTQGMLNGKLVIGLTKSCYYRLLSDQ